MQVKAEFIQNDNIHHSNFQHEEVMDLSKPNKKKFRETFSVSESGALDLSAPKYKNGENGQSFTSSPKFRKVSLDDESDSEEGRLVIDDTTESECISNGLNGQNSKPPADIHHTRIADPKELFQRSSDELNAVKYNDEVSKMTNPRQNGERGHLDNSINSNNVNTSSFDHSRMFGVPPGIPSFPNMNMKFPLQLNLAQTLMVMNMNGMMPLPNPLVSQDQLKSQSQQSIKNSVTGNQTGSQHPDSIGPVKSVSSGRRARLSRDTTGEKSVIEIYECKICNRKFSQVGNFHNHMKTHSQAEKICVCGICKVEFQDSYELQRHMRTTHTGDMPYKCEQCNREFSQYNNLRRHLRVHNGNLYKCQICGRTFNESFYLEMHLSSHTGERTYKCGICNFTCKENADLQAHIKSHRADELHTCDVCNKSFSKACVLRQHKKMHTGIRPFKCEVCEKAFIHRHHLTIHSRMHSTNRPYTCKICKKEFAQTSHLYKHIRQHSEENVSEIQVRTLLEELQKSQSKQEVLNSSRTSSPLPRSLSPFEKNGKEKTDDSDVGSETESKISMPLTLSEKERFSPQISVSVKSGHCNIVEKQELQDEEKLTGSPFPINKSVCSKMDIGQRDHISVQENIINQSNNDSGSVNGQALVSENEESATERAVENSTSCVAESVHLKKSHSPELPSLSKELPSSTGPADQHSQKLPDFSLSNKISNPESESESKICENGVHPASENLLNEDAYRSVSEGKAQKLNKQQVLVDKIINQPQSEPKKEADPKETEKVSLYPGKRTKENADVGGLVARLLQEQGIGLQNGSADKSTDTKHRKAPTKRKQKQNGLVDERPVMPIAKISEDQQAYLMHLQQFQAVQMAMMNPFIYRDYGVPLSPSLINTQGFDFKNVDQLKRSSSDSYVTSYSDQIRKHNIPFHASFYENGGFDLSKGKTLTGGYFEQRNRELGHVNGSGSSPGRFSSPSLSDDFSDGAIDMSSKRSHTGSTSSCVSDDAVESD